MGYDWKDIHKIVEEIPVTERELEEKKILIYGAGVQGRWACEYLKDRYQIAGFTDKNPTIWGKDICEKHIFPLEEALKMDDCIWVVSNFGTVGVEIKRWLQINHITAVTYMEICLLLEEEAFYHVYRDMLKDNISQKIYISIIMGRLTGDSAYFANVYEQNQYFAIPEMNIISDDSVWVDVGAYIGDTMETYIQTTKGIFKRIYAFEPYVASFDELFRRTQTLCKEWNILQDKIVLINKALGECEKKRYCIETGKSGAEKVVDEAIGNRVIDVIKLDDFFEKRESPTFIKADIEGDELAMLQGARECIAKSAPELAICIYHKPEDLYVIPNYIKHLNEHYKIWIRHHMPVDGETVLYANNVKDV